MRASIAIGSYFFLNLLVTITNKIILDQTSSGYLLTAWHAFSTLIFTTVIQRIQSWPRLHLSLGQHITLALFSSFYTLNIIISNLSLGLVSIPLHQVIRSSGPAITILLTLVLLCKPLSSYTLQTYLSLIPSILGIVITTMGSQYSASTVGIMLTMAGAVFAALKTILTNLLQTSAYRVSGSAADLVQLLTPYACLQALWFSFSTHEAKKFMQIDLSVTIMCLIALNGLSAALLNIFSFEANKQCGPVSMAVAANLKQIAILVIEALQRRSIDSRLVVGTVMTVVGGMWYAISQRSVGISTVVQARELLKAEAKNENPNLPV